MAHPLTHGEKDPASMSAASKRLRLGARGVLAWLDGSSASSATWQASQGQKQVQTQEHTHQTNHQGQGTKGHPSQWGTHASGQRNTGSKEQKECESIQKHGDEVAQSIEKLRSSEAQKHALALPHVLLELCVRV